MAMKVGKGIGKWKIFNYKTEFTYLYCTLNMMYMNQILQVILNCYTKTGFDIS